MSATPVKLISNEAQAHRQLGRLFFQFTETIAESEREDFFDPRNDWQSAFARYIEKWRAEVGAPND